MGARVPWGCVVLQPALRVPALSAGPPGQAPLRPEGKGALFLRTKPLRDTWDPGNEDKLKVCVQECACSLPKTRSKGPQVRVSPSQTAQPVKSKENGRTWLNIFQSCTNARVLEQDKCKSFISIWYCTVQNNNAENSWFVIVWLMYLFLIQ